MASIAGIAKRTIGLGDIAFDMSKNYDAFSIERKQFDEMERDKKDTADQRRLVNYRHVLFVEMRDSLIENLERILRDLKDTAFDKEWE